MPSPKAVVCHITIMHDPFDVRIFHKECQALLQAGYEMHYLVPHDRDEVLRGVHLHAMPKARGMLDKAIVWPRLAFRRVLAMRPRPSICHFFDPGLLPLGMALRLKGFKVIYDVRESVADQLLHKPYIPRPLRKPASRRGRSSTFTATPGITGTAWTRSAPSMTLA